MTILLNQHPATGGHGIERRSSSTLNGLETPRMLGQSERTNPREGRVVWSPVKSLWFISHALVAVIGGFLTFRCDAVLLSFVFFVTTMCLGTSIGFHGLLVHRSFECLRWLESVFVYLGTVAGMGGPFIFVRITVSMLILYLFGYFAHNSGSRDWHLNGHSVQGHNVPYLDLLTMGESWHNNHHAFPGSAKLGLRASQHNPGWWVLCALRALGLVWNIKLPSDLPDRPELVRLGPSNVEHLGDL